MGSLFDSGLTKSGLQTGGNTTYYDSPEQTMQAANAAYPAVNAAAQGVPQLTPNGGIEFKSQPVQAPKVVKPSFAQASESQALNPAKPSGLTRAGFLVNMLTRGLEGGLAGLGKRTVGEGFQAGAALPFQQAKMRQDIQQGELQNQMEQERINQIPVMRQRQQLQDQLTQAQIGNLTAQANAKESPADKMIHTYVGSDGKQHAIFQRSDNSTYDSTFGDVNQPDPRANFSPMGMWHDAFVRENKREPTIAEINKAERDRAQAMHITVTNPGQTAPPATGDFWKQTGDEALATLRATNPQLANNVASVRSYDADPKLFSNRSGARDTLLAAVRQVDPTFNPSQYALGYKTRQSFVGDGKNAMTLMALNTAIGHLGMLDEAAQALRNGNYQKLNQIGNFLGVQVGNDAVTNFNNINNAVSGEVAKVYHGGVPNESDVRAIVANMNPNMSPEQLRGGMAKTVGLLDSRLSQLYKNYTDGTKRAPDFDFLNPESVQILNRLGVKMHTGDTGSSSNTSSGGNKQKVNWVTNSDGIRVQQ